MNLTANAQTILEKRYLRTQADGTPETPDEMFRRVARNISQAELNYKADEAIRREWEERFYDLMSAFEFLPNSPTLMNAGTDIQQLSACFVLPVEDSMEAIFDSVKNAALIHKSGGGTGFSFSRLRPRDDEVQSTHGVSSGPVSFMGVFDAATEAVKQGGRRRGANMAILRVDHPDIINFIESKNKRDRLNNFNISVAITDAFMAALEAGEDYALVNPRTGNIQRQESARRVFDLIVESAWKSGEPGIVFIDRINAHNPTPQIGPLESTNPCGEQPLLPYESCNLGSINLNTVIDSSGATPRVDYDRLGKNVRTAVRFLDNVIDMSRFPLADIERQTRANRKVGLGVMGFADLLVCLEIPYDSDEGVETAEDIMRFIRTEAVRATEILAEERGPFPNLPGSVFDGSAQPPRRNATTTTIAPTGTISIIANASSGVEPLFALAYIRNVLDDQELVEINPLFEQAAQDGDFYSEALMKKVAAAGSVANLEEVPLKYRRIFRTAHDISPEAHIRMQAAFQKHTDNAVSKTVNFPKDATVHDVQEVFELAFKLDCKGVTVYRDGSRDAQVLNIGEVNRRGDAIPTEKKPRQRPTHMIGSTTKMPTGCGNLYVTINEDDHGPFELFAQMGKAGGCAASQAEAIGRLVSLSMRSGVDPQAIVKQLRGVRCPSPCWDGGSLVMSCSDAISKALAKHASGDGAITALADEALVNRSAGLCPDCGTALEFDGGCSVCRLCGYSRCG